MKAQSLRHDQSLIFVSLGLSVSVDSLSLFSCFAHMGLVGDAVISLSEFLNTKSKTARRSFTSFETCFFLLIIPTSFEIDNLLSFSCSSDPVPPSSSLHEAHSLPDSDVSINPQEKH